MKENYVYAICKICTKYKKCIGTRFDSNKAKVFICDNCRSKLLEEWLKGK